MIPGIYTPTPEQWAEARAEAQRRQENAKAWGSQENDPMLGDDNDPLSYELAGAIAEIAFRDATRPHFRSTGPGLPDFITPTGIRVEVKSSQRYRNLLVQAKKVDRADWYVMTYVTAATVEFVGFAPVAMVKSVTTRRMRGEDSHLLPRASLLGIDSFGYTVLGVGDDWVWRRFRGQGASHLARLDGERWTSYCGILHGGRKWQLDRALEFDQTIKCAKCTRLVNDGKAGVLFG